MADKNLPQQQGGVVDELNPTNGQVTYTDLPDPMDEDEQRRVARGEPTPAPTDESVSVDDAQDDDAQDDLPPEFKGKTPAQIAKMYKELHSAYGRQGNELGQVRQLADTIIKERSANRLAPVAPAAPKEPDEVDYFADPKKAIAQAIANSPELQALRGESQRLAAEGVVRRQAENTAVFNAQHPDAAEILADPDFREWVGASKVRQALLASAHKQFNVDAANEVFGNWKAIKKAGQPSDDAAAAAGRAARARAETNKKGARVPTSGNAAPTQGTGGKIYRRADILQLMQNDPDRYQALEPEINLAYQEGRVR